MKNYLYKPLIVLVLSAAISLQMLGCEKEELYTLSQEEEIERFIDDSDVGKSFFAKSQFVDSVTFAFPDDDAVYMQTFDSLKRNYAQTYLGKLIELETGEYYFSNTTVTDWLYYSLHKEVSGEISDYPLSARLRRFGFLVKLGSNGQAFSGWLLQGYADTATALNVQTLDGTRLWLDDLTSMYVAGTDLTLPKYRDSFVVRDYMDIDNVSVIDGACQLEVGSCDNCVTIAYYQTDAGFVAQVLPEEWPVAECYSDTAAFGDGSSVVWTSLSLQTICKVNDSTFTSSIRCVPFKVNH